MCKWDIFYLVVYGFILSVGMVLFLSGSIHITVEQNITDEGIVTDIILIAAGIITMTIVAIGIRQVMQSVRMTKEWSRIDE